MQLDALEGELSDLRNLPADEAPYEDIDELPHERPRRADGEEEEGWGGYDDDALLAAALRDEEPAGAKGRGDDAGDLERGR